MSEKIMGNAPEAGATAGAPDVTLRLGLAAKLEFAAIGSDAIMQHTVAELMREAAARIRELEAEREWRPIDDAAKKAKRVDLLGRCGKKWKRVPDCYWHHKAERWMTCHHDNEGYSALRLPFEPTHYRLLPKEWPNGQPRSGVAPDLSPDLKEGM